MVWWEEFAAVSEAFWVAPRPVLVELVPAVLLVGLSLLAFSMASCTRITPFHLKSISFQ